MKLNIMSRYKNLPSFNHYCRLFFVISLSLILYLRPTNFSYATEYDLEALVRLSLEDLTNVIVVARKREESIFSVPSSISVFTYEEIEQQDIRTIEDVYGHVPGLYVTGNALSPNRDFRQLVIRGVGANSQLEPSVATFINGVYAPALAFDFELLNVERVEVLKGPQGSLFGRNTEGGALNIITRKPDATFRADLSLFADEFNTHEIKAQVNGPLSTKHKLFGQFAAIYRETDGFIKNNRAVATPEDEVVINFTNILIPREFGHDSLSRQEQDQGDTELIRAGLRFLGKNNLDIQLNADYSRYYGGDQSPGPLSSCDCYDVNGDSIFNQKLENNGASLTLNWETSFAQLTSITGWRELESSSPWDFDGVAEFQDEPRIGNVHDWDMRQKVFSEELRLTSFDDGSINWLAGFYYFEEQNNSDRFYIVPSLTEARNSNAFRSFSNGSWSTALVNTDRVGNAVFGQVTVDINDHIELAFGARYSSERAEVSALTRACTPFQGLNSSLGDGSSGPNGGLNTACGPDDPRTGWTNFTTPVNDSERWDSLSTSMSAKYTWTSGNIAYFSFSEGFKAGSYQKAPFRAFDVSPIAPEELDSYELGFKNRWFDERLSLSSALFYIELSDMQLQSAVNVDGIPLSIINNASSARSSGLELSAVARLNANLHMSLNYGYNDTEFIDYQVSENLDSSGASFPNTPRQTFSIAAQYNTPINSNITLQSDLSYRFVDETYVNDGSNLDFPIIDVPSWQQWDFSLSFNSKKWRSTFFIDNLTDERVILSRWNTLFIEPRLSFVHDRVAPPRRLGLRFTYKY